MRLIVIGGGAAGFFCAVNAARMNPSLEVIIVEKTGKLLSKVRISGGGRCNVTHACFDIAEMTRKYPRGMNFVKRTFHQFFTEDTIVWFKERGVLLKTETDGRMFPVSDSSETIINCLLSEADKYKVRIWMNKEVKYISAEETVGGLSPAGGGGAERRGWTSRHAPWKLQFAHGEEEYADFICVACGGYPKDSMFEWLVKTGHSFENPVPSLFTFNMPGNPLTALMGISLTAKIKIHGSKLEEEGALLVTHWGLSGPAVLKLSARGAREFATAGYRFTISVNWISGYNEQLLKERFGVFRTENAAQKVMNRNGIELPQRLWEFLCRQSGVEETMRWADLPSAIENKLLKNVCTCELKVQGKTTFKEEFVTAGGIKLAEIDPMTMQSRLAPGLYFAGEVIDVDGVTGGFNFQHAWTSGWIAGKSIAETASFE